MTTGTTPQTPGQICYDAYWRAFAPQGGPTYMHAWADVHPQNQAAWEAAAEAVLAQRAQMWTAEGIVQQINAREAASLEALKREAEETP